MTARNESTLLQDVALPHVQDNRQSQGHSNDGSSIQFRVSTHFCLVVFCLRITFELADMEVDEYRGHLQRQKVVLEAAQKRKGQKATNKPDRFVLQMMFSQVGWTDLAGSSQSLTSIVAETAY